MNKKILIAVLSLSLITPVVAKAEPMQQPTVAVLDTALDTTIPAFKDKVVYEACVLEWNSCPNGQSVMEGPGSAFMPIKLMQQNSFQHGTQMVSALIKTNPNAKIVFVRIIGATSTGTRQIANEATFVKALDWVIANKDRLNIQAVSMSQGHHNLPNVADYCPKTVSTQSRIKTLVSAGIPVFLPAGNARDYKKIDWPACIDDSISVGASTDYEEIPVWSNVDINKTDFYALGTMRLVGPGNIESNQVGTSISAQVAAANWIALKTAKPTYTYQQLYDTFKKTSVSISNPKALRGNMMYLQGALNG